MSDPSSMKVIDNINAISGRIGNYELYDANLMQSLTPDQRREFQKAQNERTDIRVTNDLERLQKLYRQLEHLQKKEKANFRKNR